MTEEAQDTQPSPEEGNEPRVYEIGYLILPTVREEDLAQSVARFKEPISEAGAVVITEEYPKLIQLAYRMEKTLDNKINRFSTAYFGWTKFEVDPANLEELTKKIDANKEVLRYLLIQTVRENTIASKRLLTRPVRSTKETTEERPVVKEEKVAIDEEKLDKEIEELVVE